MRVNERWGGGFNDRKREARGGSVFERVEFERTLQEADLRK